MAEFSSTLPQLQNPDILGAYLRGQQGATEAATAPQEQQIRGLQIDQLRQTMAQQGLIQQYARQLAGQTQPTGGSTGVESGGPQGAVSASDSQGYQSPNVNTMMALDVLQ